MFDRVASLSDNFFFVGFSISKRTITLFLRKLMYQCLGNLEYMSRHQSRNHNITCFSFLHVEQLFISKFDLSSQNFSIFT